MVNIFSLLWHVTASRFPLAFAWAIILGDGFQSLCCYHRTTITWGVLAYILIISNIALSYWKTVFISSYEYILAMYQLSLKWNAIMQVACYFVVFLALLCPLLDHTCSLCLLCFFPFTVGKSAMQCCAYMREPNVFISDQVHQLRYFFYWGNNMIYFSPSSYLNPHIYFSVGFVMSDMLIPYMFWSSQHFFWISPRSSGVCLFSSHLKCFRCYSDWASDRIALKI